MPPLRDRKSIAKNLRKYRLEIARAIDCNEIFKSLIQGDIESTHEIAELCDAYAIKIMCEWLGTKYGFSAYTSAIESDHSRHENSLDLWSIVRSEYPFANCAISDRRDLSNGKAQELLESALEPDLYLLGTLYELVVAEPLVFDGTGRIYIKKESNGRLYGQFYTPPWIVRYCFERAWPESSNKFITAFKAGSGGSAGEQITPRPDFKLLDPACGSGNFLIGALDWLSENGIRGEELLRVAEHCLYGVEVDGRAASLARIALLLLLSPHLTHLKGSHGQAFVEAFVKRLWQSLQEHIVVSDSVMRAALLDDGFDAGTFDLVVTNPPYISFGSRNQLPQPESQARFLRRSYPDTTEYKIRLHSVFQEIAIRHARDGGCVVLFLPDAFLTGSYYQKLRRRLLKDVRIESLTELPDKAMSGPTVGRWCVASYKVTHAGEDCSYDLELLSYVDVEKTFDSSAPARQKQAPALRYKLPVETMVAPDKARFRLVFNDMDRDLWLSVDKLPPLSSVLRGHTGIRALAGQKSIVSNQCRGANWSKGIVSGSGVTRHLVTWDDAWLNINPDLLFGGGYDALVVERPKLMVRQTADRLIAGYDDGALYHLNNVHSLSPVDNLSLNHLADLFYYDGLINSSLWLYLYQSKSREAGRALAQIDIEMLEAMPIPTGCEEIRRLVSRLAKAAARLYGRRGADRSCPQVIKLLSLLERAIDRLVYDLYDLSDAQILSIEAHCLHRLPYQGDLPARDEICSLSGSLEAVGEEE